jgi:hypothetical protein
VNPNDGNQAPGLFDLLFSHDIALLKIVSAAVPLGCEPAF